MKINKVETLVANFHDREESMIYKINLKQALNYKLVLKKLHRVIKFNKNVWLKSYIDINTEVRNKAVSNSGKKIF